MISKGLRGLTKAYHDQRGANMFVTLSIMFGLMLVVPIFVDFASLHFSHRISQTGADAAAHAAAVEWARRRGEPYSFTTLWNGECGQSAREVAVTYREMVVIGQHREASLGYTRARKQAVDYAGYHQSSIEKFLPRYPSRTPGTCQYPAGEEICALEIYVKTRRPVPLVYQSLYGGARQAPAEAVAEVYMDPREPFEIRSVRCEEGGIRYDINFNWIVRLISR